MLQFKCEDGSDSVEDKEYLIKFEAMPINISDRSVDKDSVRVAFMII